jgi:2-polyprenyl-6-methoxyphenol hydroxylase-like FAD-dependent oxidoreductase
MAKRITIIGTGYVGLVAAVGLADFGNIVTGVDKRKEIVESLNNRIPTIYEHGLAEYLVRNIEAGRLTFTTVIETAIKKRRGRDPGRGHANRRKRSDRPRPDPGGGAFAEEHASRP